LETRTLLFEGYKNTFRTILLTKEILHHIGMVKTQQKSINNGIIIILGGRGLCPSTVGFQVRVHIGFQVHIGFGYILGCIRFGWNIIVGKHITQQIPTLLLLNGAGIFTYMETPRTAQFCR